MQIQQHSKRLCQLLGFVTSTLVVCATPTMALAVPRPALKPIVPHATTALQRAAARQNGSSGVGDPFLPLAGNDGYDVDHYDLDLEWDPESGILRGQARLRATAYARLEAFNLDLVGFEVESIKVNNRRAQFTREGQELTVVPARRLRFGESMDIEVRYQGVPEFREGEALGRWGWLRTDDGVLALAEPDGAPTWFPSNDHPSDKATFSVSMLVPKSLQVLGNGLPGLPTRKGNKIRYRWYEPKPMAPYLATVAIGHFNVSIGHSPQGIVLISGVDPRMASESQPALARLGEIVDWEASVFGPYPFTTAGAIVDFSPDVHYALETQTRPVYTRVPDDSVLVHEMAHQWFGNSVSVATWPEIWLNEGFATFAQWLWHEREFGMSTRDIVDIIYADIPEDDPFWQIAPGPEALSGVDVLFSAPVYVRGGMTLALVRDAVGDEAFFEILRSWTDLHRYGNATTDEFIALCYDVSGQDLSALFNAWLSTPGRPVLPPRR